MLFKGYGSRRESAGFSFALENARNLVIGKTRFPTKLLRNFPSGIDRALDIWSISHPACRTDPALRAFFPARINFLLHDDRHRGSARAPDVVIRILARVLIAGAVGQSRSPQLRFVADGEISSSNTPIRPKCTSTGGSQLKGIDERLALSIDEAAEILSISRSTMKAAIRSGSVPAIRLGRRVMIPRHGLLEFMGAQPMVANRGRSYEDGVADERSRITDLLVNLLAQVRT